MNPFQKYVHRTVENLANARAALVGIDRPSVNKPRKPDAPAGMIFAPHPDDECINGGLALRLFREAGFRIINIPVTLGSDPNRQEARKTELSNACRYLGFEVEFVGSNGLTGIEPASRTNDPQHWEIAVETAADLIESFQPRVIFFPHRHDRHPAHCGTNLLVSDALKSLPKDYSCLTIETEYWQAMESPNLLVELDQTIVGDLVTALTFHTGEVERNPYHLSLPAWMIDNVRRGSEIVGPTGGAMPDFVFGVLHKVSLLKNGVSHSGFETGRFLSSQSDLSSVFKFKK